MFALLAPYLKRFFCLLHLSLKPRDILFSQLARAEHNVESGSSPLGNLRSTAAGAAKDKKRKGPKRRELGCEERARAHEGEKGFFFVKSASGAKQTVRRTEIRRVEYKTKEEPL